MDRLEEPEGHGEERVAGVEGEHLGLRPGHGMESLVAVLQGDGSPLEAVGAQAPSHRVRQLHQGGAQPRPVVGVGIVGVLGPEALRIGRFREHLPVVLAPSQPHEVVAVGAEAPFELFQGHAGEVADGGHAQPGELFFHLRPHAPEAAHGQGSEEGGFLPRLHHHEAVGLAHVRSDLGHELGGGHSHRGAETGLLADGVLQGAADALAVAEGPPALRHVEEGLVDRDGLDHGGEAPQDGHHLLRDGGVLLHVRVEVDTLGAEPPGFRDGHGAAHAELAGFVGRGGNDTPPPPALRIGANDDGLAQESGTVALLDGRVERVHVEVEDAAGQQGAERPVLPEHSMRVSAPCC